MKRSSHRIGVAGGYFFVAVAAKEERQHNVVPTNNAELADDGLYMASNLMLICRPSHFSHISHAINNNVGAESQGDEPVVVLEEPDVSL